jgi:hypothetical protein
MAPIQHKELSPDLVGRIRLIRACLLGPYTHSMGFWIEGFQRDAHPSREVAYWEHVAAVYREYTMMAPTLTGEQHEQAFMLITTLEDDEKLSAERAKDLPENALGILKNLYAHSLPFYDIKEKFTI